MRKFLKPVIIFGIFLFVYFLPSLIFRQDNEFYKSLNNNFVPPFVFIIVWILIFVLLSFISTYYYLNKDKYDRKEFIHYFILVAINYVFIFLFPLTFFVMKNLFLGYMTTLLTCVSGVFLVMQSLLLNKKITLLFIPYLLWTTFASVYSIILYLQN